MSSSRVALIALVTAVLGFLAGLIPSWVSIAIDPPARILRQENNNLREQIKVLEQMVATQQAQLDEINAVIGPQELGELDLDSIQLEVTTEPRGAVDLPPRYDLIDVVDEQPGVSHEQE